MAGITREDVWRAADALLVAAQRPTIERIRQHLGRGSPNTVGPHLDSWFSQLGTRIRSPEEFVASVAPPAPLAQLAAQWWETALNSARDVANQEIEAKRVSLQEASAALMAAQEDFEAEKARLRDQHIAAQAQIQAQASQLDSLRADLQRARAELNRGNGPPRSRSGLQSGRFRTLRPGIFPGAGFSAPSFKRLKRLK